MTHIRAAIILLLGVALVGCSTLFESDNQEPPAELTQYEPTIAIKTLWSKDIGVGSAGQALRLIPVFAQGRLYVADREGLVQALDANSGEILWRTNTAAPLSSGPGLGEGQVFLGTSKAEIIALAMTDGRELWRAGVSSEVIAVPKAAEGTVVVHTIDGRLYGLKTTTGERKWAYDHSEPALTLRGNSSPLVRHDTVIAGLSNGVLINLVLATGEPRWEVVMTQSQGRSELERIVDIDADPVLRDGLIYAATYQGEIAAIEYATGAAVWRRKMSVYTDLTVDQQRLYVTDADSRVWALDLHSGAALWQQNGLLNRRLTAPAILGKHILVGDLDGYVHWLAYADGAQQARIRVDSSPLSTPPVVVKNVAYLYSDDGTLAAITIDSPTAK